MAKNPSIEFHVRGLPAPDPRARKGRGGHWYKPDTVKAWKAAIATFAARHMPSEPWVGPVKFESTLGLLRPDYMTGPGWPTGVMHADNRGSGDSDNLAKVIMDVLTRLGLWVDDCQVVSETCRKFYVEIGGEPGAWVRCELLQDPDDVSAMRLIEALKANTARQRRPRKSTYRGLQLIGPREPEPSP